MAYDEDDSIITMKRASSGPEALVSKMSSISIPEPEDILPDDTDETIIRKDLLISNTILKVLHLSWASVTSLDGVCKLADTTMTMMEKRRKLMNRKLGSDNKSESSKPSWTVPTIS